MLTQSQKDTVASIRAEFLQYPASDQIKMYRVLAFIAALKWPEVQSFMEYAKNGPAGGDGCSS